MDMLHVKRLSKIYGGRVTYRALTDIDFTIKKGVRRHHGSVRKRENHASEHDFDD